MLNTILEAKEKFLRNCQRIVGALRLSLSKANKSFRRIAIKICAHTVILFRRITEGISSLASALARLIYNSLQCAYFVVSSAVEVIIWLALYIFLPLLAPSYLADALSIKSLVFHYSRFLGYATGIILSIFSIFACVAIFIFIQDYVLDTESKTEAARKEVLLKPNNDIIQFISRLITLVLFFYVSLFNFTPKILFLMGVDAFELVEILDPINYLGQKNSYEDKNDLGQSSNEKLETVSSDPNLNQEKAGANDIIVQPTQEADSATASRITNRSSSMPAQPSQEKPKRPVRKADIPVIENKNIEKDSASISPQKDSYEVMGAHLRLGSWKYDAYLCVDRRNFSSGEKEYGTIYLRERNGDRYYGDAVLIDREKRSILGRYEIHLTGNSFLASVTSRGRILLKMWGKVNKERTRLEGKNSNLCTFRIN